MDSAIKVNGMYESIPFNTSSIQTEGKNTITLQAKLDSFVKYQYLPKCNTVTKLDFPDEVTLKLVSKYPFNYTLPGIQPRYSNKRKIEDFLYEIQYGNIDYEYAKQYYLDTQLGGCSAIRKNNEFGRNFDWIYNNDVQFVVHTPTTLSRNAVLGVSSIIPGITKNTVDQDNIIVGGVDMFKLLPFYLVDGINEKGLFVTHNVVPLDNEDEPTRAILAKKEERDRIPAPMLVRYILDNFDTADQAIRYIKDYVTIYFTDLMIDTWHYQTHLLIGDNIHTYVVEFIAGELIVHKQNYITNFQITGVNFDKDNHVISPYIENGINKYGFGLERWNLLADSKNIKDMHLILDAVKYSLMYNEDNFRYSEIVRYLDDNEDYITVDTTPELCSITKEEQIELYNERDRDNPQIWITCHSSIYNIKNKQLYIKNQEGVTEYTFSLCI